MVGLALWPCQIDVDGIVGYVVCGVALWRRQVDVDGSVGYLVVGLALFSWPRTPYRSNPT